MLQSSRSGRHLLEGKPSDPPPVERLGGGDGENYSAPVEWERAPILTLVGAVLGAGVLGE